MIEPLEIINLGDNPLFETTLTVSVYEDFIQIVVRLTIQESADAMRYGGVEEERNALNSLLRRIFNEPFDALKIFSNEIEAGYWKETISIATPDLSNGGWSKTALILLDKSSFEASLEKALTYIKNSFSNFKNPRETAQNIAKAVSSKVFKRKN